MLSAPHVCEVTEEHEIVERVAAIDVAKATGTVWTRLPHTSATGKPELRSPTTDALRPGHRAHFDLVEDRTRVEQNVEKILEDAPVKISSVLKVHRSQAPYRPTRLSARGTRPSRHLGSSRLNQDARQLSHPSPTQSGLAPSLHSKRSLTQQWLPPHM